MRLSLFFNASTYLGGTHNSLTSHLLLLHQLNISSTDCTSTGTKESDVLQKKRKKTKTKHQQVKQKSNANPDSLLTAYWYQCKS